MSKRLVVSIVAVLAAGMFSPLLRAQDEQMEQDPAEAGRLQRQETQRSRPAPRPDGHLGCRTDTGGQWRH